MGDENICATLSRMLAEQRVGVLCTVSGKQPHGSPLCFIVSADLRRIAFATGRSTRKYRNLRESPSVAFVVDNRTSAPRDPAHNEVLIARGEAAEAALPGEIEALRRQLTARHPDFRPFFVSPDTAFFEIIVQAYTYVSGFQPSVEFTM